MHNEVIDTIICGAAVDLFHAWDIAVAPIPPTRTPPSNRLPEVAASVECRSPGHTITLYLCCPLALVNSAHEDDGKKPDVADWVREMTNQLAGKISRRYRHGNAELKLSLPKSVHIDMLTNRVNRMEKMSCYQFRTIWGPIVLVIEGELDGSKISYAGTPDSEKGMILL